MQRTTIDFGIDLGTTNSTVAVIDGTDARVIPGKGNSVVTPSAVGINKRGDILVGQEAKLRALVNDKDNADVEFKLRMGDGAEGKKVFARDGREMLPEELSAEVLKELKKDVRSSMGEEMGAAVITVPAAFENPSTNATMKAAKLAGFGTSPLLLEPVAASLAYGFQSESENVYWFTYDFGGGTFDAAVMRIRDGLIQVVNHNGDNFLGGKLIDWDIVTRKLIPAITSQHNLPDFRRGTPRWEAALGKMKYYAELAKIEVCRSRESHEVWIEGLCEDADGKEVDFAYTLTPDDVEEVSRPYIEKSLILCRETLEGSGLKGSDMERVLMVGGTTLNPWVRDAVQSELGARIEVGIDPVTVVARGAAIFASTQPLPRESSGPVPAGTWTIEVEHKPVGNVEDPDIGGRVSAPDGRSVEGFTIEFVDTKTRWRSGRIDLGMQGVFMTQLFAERKRRCEYAIELCDPTGSRVPTSPESVSYVIGIPPEENPPASMTIGVGLANGSVATYIRKGTKLPARESMDHYTTIPLRAGNAEDVLWIPLLEGEHPRAERNHGIGGFRLTGADVRRDVPSGSQVEITLIMDASQQVRFQAYVPALDEDFDIGFDPQRKHGALDELRKEADDQKGRLANVRERTDRSKTPKADAALSRIEDLETIEQIDALLEAAESDRDAVAMLDRRLRELASAVDEVEDSVEWPGLLEDMEKARSNTERVVNEYGAEGDHNRLSTIKGEIQAAVEAGDPDLLRRRITELNSLWFEVLNRQPEFVVAHFNSLAEQVHLMTDTKQAELIVGQGRRAINNNDIEALKAANRQLTLLLPDDPPLELHKNWGKTMTHN